MRWMEDPVYDRKDSRLELGTARSADQRLKYWPTGVS